MKVHTSQRNEHNVLLEKSVCVWGGGGGRRQHEISMQVHWRCLKTRVCVCVCVCKKKKKKGIVTGQNQPLRAVWCNTRLLNSGGQFDQTCNLFGGAIPAQGLC